MRSRVPGSANPVTLWMVSWAGFKEWSHEGIQPSMPPPPTHSYSNSYYYFSYYYCYYDYYYYDDY